MNCPEKAFEALKETPLGKAIEAYNNPRLSGDGSDYLNAEHRDELRAQSEIVYFEPSAPLKIYDGVGSVQKVTVGTKQGYEYDGIIGEPWIQKTDSLAIATRPLGTSGGGYNLHTILNYMRAGNNVAFLSLRGSRQFEDSSETLTRISLANTAAALLRFGNEVQRRQTKKGLSIHPQNRFTYGSSHAGAVALVANAIDTDFEQKIRASDAIAPSPTIRLENLRQWVKLGEQALHEPFKVPFILGRLGVRLTLHYRNTVELDLRNLSHQLELCGGIFNGELNAAAAHIAGGINGNTIRITEYDGDRTCNDGGLEQTLSPNTHPNTSFEERRGIHMTIIDPDVTLPIMMGFNKAYQEQESGTNPINSGVLFTRAKELAPRQFPITKEQIPTPIRLTEQTSAPIRLRAVS